MNYEVRRHGKRYKIYEIPTKQYITYYWEKQKAEDVCRNLNNGGGFDGNTPTFMIKTA